MPRPRFRPRRPERAPDTPLARALDDRIGEIVARARSRRRRGYLLFGAAIGLCGCLLWPWVALGEREVDHWPLLVSVFDAPLALAVLVIAALSEPTEGGGPGLYTRRAARALARTMLCLALAVPAAQGGAWARHVPVLSPSAWAGAAVAVPLAVLVQCFAQWRVNEARRTSGDIAARLHGIGPVNNADGTL